LFFLGVGIAAPARFPQIRAFRCFISPNFAVLFLALKEGTTVVDLSPFGCRYDLRQMSLNLNPPSISPRCLGSRVKLETTPPGDRCATFEKRYMFYQLALPCALIADQKSKGPGLTTQEWKPFLIFKCFLFFYIFLF